MIVVAFRESAAWTSPIEEFLDSLATLTCPAGPLGDAVLLGEGDLAPLALADRIVAAAWCWRFLAGIFPMKVREVIRLLEREGWYHVVTRGSHRQFKHRWRPGRVTVSGNLGNDMPLGTLAAVLRQAGLRGD